ncbi:MAG: hypothetical protein NVS2B16_12770 [Chloroflexota bacterium]
MQVRIAVFLLFAGVIACMVGEPRSNVWAASVQGRDHAVIDVVKEFGYAGTHRPFRTLDSFAADTFLAGEPHHSLAAAMDLSPTPAHFSYRFQSINDRFATVTVRWTYGYVKTVVDRLVWVRSVSGWRVVKVLRMPGPALTLVCGLPSRGTVSCRLSGHDFDPAQRVAITYHLTYLALPRRNGSYQERVWAHFATTNADGSFVRPPLVFGVVKYHESYRLTVTVNGERSDAATVTLVATAQ